MDGQLWFQNVQFCIEKGITVQFSKFKLHIDFQHDLANLRSLISLRSNNRLVLWLFVKIEGQLGSLDPLLEVWISPWRMW